MNRVSIQSGFHFRIGLSTLLINYECLICFKRKHFFKNHTYVNSLAANAYLNQQIKEKTPKFKEKGLIKNNKFHLLSHKSA